VRGPAIANHAMEASLIAPAPMPRAPLPAIGRRLDAESLDWVEALAGTGGRRDAAIDRLHELLLRAARFEVARRRRSLGDPRVDLDDLALQAANDALMAILNKLHTYRGDSRFTTWAYKFALLEAAVKVRRRAWHGREVLLETAVHLRATPRRPSWSARWAARSART
jgi:RNA polymerase sigma-70 factor, ECF subfamily